MGRRGGRGRATWLVAVTVAGTALAASVLVGGGTALASWSDQNCTGSSNDMGVWQRADAKTYAQKDANEGYEWGGGCFRLNDHDDTPGAPDSGGEGTDCSGLVFKAWAMRSDGGWGYRYWDHTKEIHGPYSTNDYYDPTANDPFRTIAKGYTSTVYMDAFVYRNSSDTAGHVGMIYSEGSGGGDYIVESKGDADGTDIFYETYRSQSAYRGLERKNWTPDCYPRCSQPS